MTMNLKTIRELDSEIKSLEGKLKGLKNSVLTVSTSRITGSPRAKAIDSRIEVMTQKIVDIETELAELNQRREELALQLSLEIYERVKRVDVGRILYLRYVECLPFSDVLTQFDYTEQHIWRLHREGVKQFNAVEEMAKKNDTAD